MRTGVGMDTSSLHKASTIISKEPENDKSITWMSRS